MQNLNLFKCDHCQRILYKKQKNSFPCSSCGHGVMRPQKPKTFCCECGDPIYDNVDPSRDVVCGSCVSNLLTKVKHSEKTMKTKFMDTSDMKQKTSYFRAKLKKDPDDKDLDFKSLGKRLKSARKKVGWTQEKCARYFNLKSKASINRYEKNLRMIPKEIIKWINKIEGLKKKQAREKYGRA